MVGDKFSVSAIVSDIVRVFVRFALEMKIILKELMSEMSSLLLTDLRGDRWKIECSGLVETVSVPLKTFNSNKLEMM